MTAAGSGHPAAFFQDKKMNNYEGIRRSFRHIRLKNMVGGENRSAPDIAKAVDTLIGWAHRDEAEEVRVDRVLFDFEAEFEEISDEIAKLSDRGEAEAYRDIYAKLYAFADEMMADSYMPLYLYILYRYANALFKTGEARRAAELFEKLCDGTERMIGIRNTYGIHCLEQLALAAEAAGQHEKALAAMEAMTQISEEEFGEDSAVAIAVRRFCGRFAAQNS